MQHQPRAHLLKVLAVFLAERRFVLRDELLLLLGIVHPEAARADEVGTRAALGTRADDFVVELLRLPPRPDALKAEAVIAVGQDPEALFASILLPHDVEADAAGFLLRSLDGERQFHFLLVRGDALRVVLLALVAVERVEAELAAQLAQLAVGVHAVLVAAVTALHEERTQRCGVVEGNPLDGLLAHSVGVHHIGVGLGRIVGIKALLERRHKDGRLRVQAVR